jgi:protocatechuate 3,4-dioxygenase beta subunit
MKGREDWTTQLYAKGHPGNLEDNIFKRIGSEEARETVTKKFVPVENSTIGELAVRFDIVLGVTPKDDHHAGD